MKRRNTQTKEVVLEILKTAGKAMSQDEIQNMIIPEVNRTTVYRVLNQFYEDGIVHKVVADNGKQYFAVYLDCEGNAMKGHHFHFRCTKCDTIKCLSIPVSFSIPKGYQIEDVNCVLTGVCKDCTN